MAVTTAQTIATGSRREQKRSLEKSKKNQWGYNECDIDKMNIYTYEISPV